MALKYVLSWAQPLNGAYKLLPVNPCFYVQSMSVHHHNEAHDMFLFLGIKRSQRARANRNTHINERSRKKVIEFADLIALIFLFFVGYFLS